MIVALAWQTGANRNQLHLSYPQSDRTPNNVQYGVDHEKILVVNIGKLFGFVSTDENEETLAQMADQRHSADGPPGQQPEQIYELPDRWYGYEVSMR